jgi:NAD(P)-dependent dehydrogenase (short-subunit alcohol dehydrogenase family)
VHKQGLVTNGAKVYVAALPSDPISEVVADLNKLGRDSGGSAQGHVNRVFTRILLIIFRVPCDVTSKDAVETLRAHIAEREDHIDILVSNAGIRRDPPKPCNVLQAPLTELQSSMWSTKPSDWADTFSVNSTAHYFMSVAFLPLLAEASKLGNGRGVVIVTSSCASMHNMTNIDLTSYATSKAATDHLVRLLAAKFSRFYVRVVGINPGCKCNKCYYNIGKLMSFFD